MKPTMNQDRKLLWGKRCTRWDIYPQQEPVQLIAFDWHGFWCPQPDGSWYKSPESFDVVGDASAPALFGEWRSKEITERLSLKYFARAEAA